jgi:hypothetical protein
MSFRSGCRLVVLIAFAFLLVPAQARASSIQIYSIPVHNTHQDYLCIFAGTSSCPQDPSGFPAPVTDTNGDFPTLTHIYAGSTLTNWNTFVGSSFVLGLDVNSASPHQTLSNLTLTFLDASNAQIGSTWTITPILIPDIHNGEGWADYVLAAGCAGSVYSTAFPIDSCTQYQPFVTPAGTASITFTFGFGGTGNDGHDDLFAIPYTDSVVPEPGTLLMVGGGLLLIARSLRRRAH